MNKSSKKSANKLTALAIAGAFLFEQWKNRNIEGDSHFLHFSAF